MNASDSIDHTPGPRHVGVGRLVRLLFAAVLALLVGVGLLRSRAIAPLEGEDHIADVSQPVATAAIPDDVNFADDIAPILYAECADCHTSGGSAPFSLVTYEEAQDKATRIARATASGIMPPWLPDTDGTTFVGERHLTARQVEIFQQWARSGTPPGDLASAPTPPQPSSGWRLGEPDLVIDIPTYVLRAEGRDVYRNIVVRIPIDRPRFVTSVELRPGDPRVVHHARMMIDTTASSLELDEQDTSGPGFDGMELRSNASNPEGHFLGWTPGKGALPPLENMAFQLEPETDLVLQLHMRTTGEVEQVESQVGFYFTDTPPTEAPVLLLLSSLMIDIPAGDPAYQVTNSYTLPVAVDLLSVYPHAHYLGKDLSGFATLPNGSRRELIRIPDWDFNWQDEYRYREPMRLPAGTVLTLDFTFDNSAENPRNPSDPPRRVVYGSNSMDEMADLILQVLPHSPTDRATLIDDAAWQNAAEDMAYLAAENLQKGQESLAAGDAAQAIVYFREVMQYQIDHPEALVGLARGFLLSEEFETAKIVAERAVEVTQYNDPRALSALADAYNAAGDPRAMETAEAALRLARARGNRALAAQIEARMAEYAGVPR